MPAVNPQGVIAAIAASLKQPVVTVTFGIVSLIAGYSITVANTKSNTTDIQELKKTQKQIQDEFLRRDDFYRESQQIRDDIRQVRDAQKETNQHLNEYIMRKDVRNAAH